MKLPGPDHPITITANPKRVRVSAGGAVIADTTHALTLKEARYPAVQYVPRADANMALLERTERHIGHREHESCARLAGSARRLYGLSMRTLYMITSGSADATRASVPLHLAVNGSLEVGHTVGVVLAGDATELLKADVRERLEGVGVPPMRDLLAKVRQHEVPVYV